MGTMQAKDAYKKAIELEPDDTNLRDMLVKCEVEERKQEAEGRVKFKSSRQQNLAKSQRSSKTPGMNGKQGAKLSFDADEDQEE